MIYCYAEPNSRGLGWTQTDNGIEYPNPRGGKLTFRYDEDFKGRLVDKFTEPISDTNGIISNITKDVTNLYFDEKTCSPLLTFPETGFNKTILLLSINIKNKIIHWMDNDNVMILKSMSTDDTLVLVVAYPEKDAGVFSLVLRSDDVSNKDYVLYRFNSEKWLSDTDSSPEIETGNMLELMHIKEKYAGMAVLDPRTARANMKEYAFVIFGGEDKETGRAYRYKIRRFRPSKPTRLILCHKRDFASMSSEYTSMDSKHMIVMFSTLKELQQEILRLKAEGYEAATLYMNISSLKSEGFNLYKNNYNLVKDTFGICNILFNNGKIHKVFKR